MAERKEKRKRENQSLGRAKGLLSRDLAWTCGFPVDHVVASDNQRVAWFRMDSLGAENPPPFLVDREVLRRSSMAASKLKNQFPKAVKRIFVDPEDWFERLERLLNAIKATLHEGDRSAVKVASLLESSAEKALTSDAAFLTIDPRLRSLLDGVQFAESMKVKPSAVALHEWLPSAATQLNAVYSMRLLAETPQDSAFSNRDYELMLLVALRDELKHREDLESLCRQLTSPAMQGLDVPDPNFRIHSYADFGKSLVKSRQGNQDIDFALSAKKKRQTIRQSIVRLMRKSVDAKPKVRRSIISVICELGPINVVQAFDSIGDTMLREENRLRGNVKRLNSDSQLSHAKSKPIAKMLLEQLEPKPVGELDVKFVKSYHSALIGLADGHASQEVVSEVAQFLPICGVEVSGAINLLSYWIGKENRGDLPMATQRQRWGTLLNRLRRIAKTTDGERVAKLVPRE